MKYIIVTLFLVVVLKGVTQTHSYTQFTIDDGLASNEVYNIIEDNQGNIWFATDHGISKYNGYEFKNFTVEDGLSNNTILGFFKDQKERIWLRTHSGHLTYIKNDTVHTILPKLTFDQIYSIYVDDADTVWVSENCIQYKIFEDLKGKFKCQQLEGFYHLRKINNTLNGVLVGVSSGYYIESVIPDEKKFNIGQLGDHYKDRSYLMHNGFVISDHEIWVSLDNKILSLAKDSLKVITTFDAAEITISITKDNEVFVGGSKGAHLLNQRNEIQSSFLKQFHVTDMIKDREGGYWFSTLSNGVFYAANLTINVSEFETSSGILSIIKTKEKLLAFDYYGDIYCRYQDLYKKVYDNTNNKLQFIGVRLNQDGEPVLQTNQGSFLYMDNELINTDVKSRLFTLNDNYEIKVNSSNVQVNDITSGDQILHEQIGKVLLRTQPIQYNDTIFIPSSTGLYRFDIKNGLINYGDTYPSLSHRVNSVSIDKYQRLWIATNELGLFLLDGENLIRVDNHKKSTGIIFRNLVTDDLFAWASTEKGLIRVDLLDPLSIRHYTTEDGLLSNGINYIYSDNDTIFLGHDKGVSQFPRNYKKKTTTPLIRIDQIKVKNKQVPAQEAYQLNYDENNIRIFYTGISYASNLSYKYKLENSPESAWTYTNDRSVEFVSISPGEYTFQVVAINSNGTTSGKPISILFTISPPFWNTWWFYLIILLTIGGLVYAYVFFRVKRMKYELEVEKKLIDVEQQALRARMNPHFIFNSMNSIQSFILSNDKRNANKYLSTFSKLMRSILENSEKKLIPISKELETLQTYTDIESLRFKNKFTFDIKIADSLNIDELKIPPLLLQPYVENAIWHGIMPKESNGLITVEILDKGKNIICIIEDNGIGRKKAKELQKTKKVLHQPAGLKITANRMSLVKVLYGVDVSVKFIDLENSGPTTGTRIEIRLPYLR